ncbi:MAG: carboxylesterase family protein [bacterium]|nr:carboxylesterase family protein [bacterium]
MTTFNRLAAFAFLLVLATPASGGDENQSPIPTAIDDRPACTTPNVATPTGAVCGLSLESDAADGGGRRRIDAYLGIPYADTTAGPNRWLPPVPAGSHQGVLKATHFGPVCPQVSDSPKADPQSEDCLSVNVWTPRAGADQTGLPVMVFIHGGSFINGASSLPIYGGAALAASGRVVVVTLNYRLGALGFLSGIEALAGNYGFLDQQLALTWVRDTIAVFGGDPDQVTLFGESAGAASIGLHLVAPASRGLFQSAIMESNPLGLPFKSPSAASPFGEALRLKLDCISEPLQCLRKQSAEAVVGAQTSLLATVEQTLGGFASELIWAPVVDGSVIPAQPLEMPIAIPVLMGTNRNEGVLFASGERLSFFGKTGVPRIEYDALLDLFFSSGTEDRIRNFGRYEPRTGDNIQALAHVLTDYLFTCPNRSAMRKATAPVYGYRFTHVPSFDVWPGIAPCAPAERKVCHTFELPFVFGNPTPVTRQVTPPDDRFTAGERALSERMAGYWIRFAEALDPNYDGVPPWPAFDEDNSGLQVLATTIRPETHPGHHCDFWDAVRYDLPGLAARIRDLL